MGRVIYTPKNRFARRSKLSEQEFVWLLELFLQGRSAANARARYLLFRNPHIPMPPSEKTIAKLFRCMGRYIFHKFVEPQLWRSDAGICQHHLDQGQDAYQRFLDDTAHNLIQNARDAMSLESFHALVSSENVGTPDDVFHMEIRALLVAHKGMTDARADVGLACYRTESPGGLPRDQIDQQHIKIMMKHILDDMQDDPMEPDGNPHSWIRIEPYKFPYANFHLPEPEQWSKRGFSVSAWRRKHARQRMLNRKKKGKNNQCAIRISMKINPAIRFVSI
ncbi:hypothetical protein [uncultured Tateyamaria sp.]|uniref:hypothetical protein n=1 Tax=uncultured Tateyamaria sp. TaxID=455651 RepID=UPI002612D498|nr:hypothetical protein [uncultured Tateyamaria sp.]